MSAKDREFDTTIDLAAFERADVFFPETVLGDDDRQTVPNVMMMPWRCVCALRIIAANGQRIFGTGFLAKRDTVITAAHNVFDHQRGGRAQGIVVIPALDGTTMPAGSHPAVGSPHLPPTWINNPTAGTDFAAIKVGSSIVDSSTVMPCAKL